MTQPPLHELLELSPLHAFIGQPEPLHALFEHVPEAMRCAFPENGVHPHAIHRMMVQLREVTQLRQETTTRVIATFSPLVINELEGHEVSVVTRDALGELRVTRLDRTPGYSDRRKVYENGELWLAYPEIEDHP